MGHEHSDESELTAVDGRELVDGGHARPSTTKEIADSTERTNMWALRQAPARL